MTTAAFLHIGEDLRFPTILARSLTRHNPGIEILQVTDLATPAIEGVSEVCRIGPYEGAMMTFRLRGFASLAPSGPCWFFDTDMICNGPLSPPAEVAPVAVCERQFGRDTIFNAAFRGMDFGEYRGRTLSQVYPWLACATWVDGEDFWRECLEELLSLDPKFALWYGDQEALRNVIARRTLPWSRLPESIYACLPEAPEPAATAQMMHYKGQRKALMLARAAAEGLI
jgi:hypothetical protein